MKIRKDQSGFGWYITYTACGQKELSKIRDNNEFPGYRCQYLNVDGIVASSFAVRERKIVYTPVIFCSHYNEKKLRIKPVFWRFVCDFEEKPVKLERTLCAKLKDNSNE